MLFDRTSHHRIDLNKDGPQIELPEHSRLRVAWILARCHCPTPTSYQMICAGILASDAGSRFVSSASEPWKFPGWLHQAEEES